MASPLDTIQEAARSQFDRQSRRYGKGHILEQVEDVAEALRHVPPVASKPPRALDVATGAGHTGLHLASRGYEVVLSDLSSEMLARASEAARERNLRVEVRSHAAEELPYPDASFDLVTCRVAAHHFSDPAAFVREASRVLRKGGSFLLIDGTVEDGRPEAEVWLHEVEIARDPSHHRFLTPGAWGRLAADAGLEVVHSGLLPFKQPDLNWYFAAANTSPENRRRVLRLVEEAPAAARSLFRLGVEEDGKVVWWWQRLTLVAVKAA